MVWRCGALFEVSWEFSVADLVVTLSLGGLLKFSYPGDSWRITSWLEPANHGKITLSTYTTLALTVRVVVSCCVSFHFKDDAVGTFWC